MCFINRRAGVEYISRRGRRVLRGQREIKAARFDRAFEKRKKAGKKRRRSIHYIECLAHVSLKAGLRWHGPSRISLV